MFDVAAVRDVVVPRLELLMANTRLGPIRARILITLKGSPDALLCCDRFETEGALLHWAGQMWSKLWIRAQSRIVYSQSWIPVSLSIALRPRSYATPQNFFLRMRLSRYSACTVSSVVLMNVVCVHGRCAA